MLALSLSLYPPNLLHTRYLDANMKVQSSPKVVIGAIAAIVVVGCSPSPKDADKTKADISPQKQFTQTPVTSPDPTSVKNSASVTAAREQYVITEVAEERLGPSETAPITNKVYRGQAVKVYETLNGWARVSDFYDGAVEGQSGKVARWIQVSSLASEPPTAPRELNIPEDPRIHLTRTPGNGLGERDVLILNAAARYFVEIGRAKGVDDGDKSLSRIGM
jgi:hypothetical protein